MKPGEAHSAHYCLQSDESRLPSSYTWRPAWPVSDSQRLPFSQGQSLGALTTSLLAIFPTFPWPVPMSPQPFLCLFSRGPSPWNSLSPGPHFLLIPDRSLFITPHPPPFHSKKGSCKLPLSAQFCLSAAQREMLYVLAPNRRMCTALLTIKTK